ncbi:hypothetical protein N7510_003921 [Penicillium lagena]|uniref:uncharacterized protein n=1 Tax=Penicillium lagena TaxID=94218 RepID=UPI00254040C5|nr:uncharacterized protein N7510_003921 [Penicillium lagena]KAJ5619937.1 hypothetical protein N7510_003921 [Penicillium lagena]
MNAPVSDSPWVPHKTLFGQGCGAAGNTVAYRCNFQYARTRGRQKARLINQQPAHSNFFIPFVIGEVVKCCL